MQRREASLGEDRLRGLVDRLDEAVDRPVVAAERDEGEREVRLLVEAVARHGDEGVLDLDDLALHHATHHRIDGRERVRPAIAVGLAEVPRMTRAHDVRVGEVVELDVLGAPEEDGARRHAEDHVEVAEETLRPRVWRTEGAAGPVLLPVELSHLTGAVEDGERGHVVVPWRGTWFSTAQNTPTSFSAATNSAKLTGFTT